VPRKGKVTVKVAVREGRAIGVTVLVAIEPPARNMTPRIAKAYAKEEAKLIAKTVTCFDSAVRTMSWPPNSRRDSFTTVY
jgi:uncharacterized protein (UPF0254 family)